MFDILKSDIEYNQPNIPLRIGIGIFVLFLLYNHFIAFDNTKLKRVEMEPFSEPIQEKIVKGETFEHKVKDGVAKITPIASYKLYGRVYDHHLRPYKLYGASMYPYDISIGFGDMQYKEVYDSIHVKMAATVSYWSCSGRKWRLINQKYFKEKPVEHYFTNNHLCPANKRVRKGISKLRKKDVVYIEGYLIKYELLRNNGRYESGTSSTARNDLETYSGNNGNGSCEQIYVTRIVTRHGDFK